MSEEKKAKKIEWTEEEKEKLREIGKRIKETLDKMPAPKRPVYPPETYEILRIWDEEELADLDKLIGAKVILPKNKFD
jgi:hypothetical protein